MARFEDLLRDLAPHLAEPLTVQAVGIRNFPLLASEWRVLPGAAKIEINHFKHGETEAEPATDESQAVPVAA